MDGVRAELRGVRRAHGAHRVVAHRERACALRLLLGGLRAQWGQRVCEQTEDLTAHAGAWHRSRLECERGVDDGLVEPYWAPAVSV